MNIQKDLVTIKDLRIFDEKVFKKSTEDKDYLELVILFSKLTKLALEGPIYAYVVTFDEQAKTLTKMMKIWYSLKDQDSKVYEKVYNCRNTRVFTEVELYNFAITDIINFLNEKDFDSSISFYLNEASEYYKKNINAFKPEGFEINDTVADAIVGASLDTIMSLDAITDMVKEIVTRYINDTIKNTN